MARLRMQWWALPAVCLTTLIFARSLRLWRLTDGVAVDRPASAVRSAIRQDADRVSRSVLDFAKDANHNVIPDFDSLTKNWGPTVFHFVQPGVRYRVNPAVVGKRVGSTGTDPLIIAEGKPVRDAFGARQVTY